MPQTLSSPKRDTRLATLERQLQRKLQAWREAPPAHSQKHARLRVTVRRRVMRDNLRNQRALRTRGHEVGWRDVPLTDEDEQRVVSLLQMVSA